MKVPDIKPFEQENNDINDVTLYRKKRKRAKLIRNLIILLLIVAAAVPVWIFRDTIFEPLRGIASKITTTTTDSAGYPIDLSGRSDYSFYSMGESFALLSDTYLYSYSADGGQIFALQHGYVNPMATSNSKRIVIYDKGGHDFSLFNKTSRIYNLSIQDEVIVSVFLGSSEYTAVVTTGGRYSNVIYVYDGNGKWQYTQRFIDENIMQAAFSDDNRYLYITRVCSDNGNIVTKLSKYDMTGEGSEIWTAIIGDCVSMALSVGGDTVTVKGDSEIVTYDAETGNQTGNQKYSGAVSCFDTADNMTAFVFDDYTDDGNVLVLLNNKCEAVASIAADPGIKCVAVKDGRVTVLTETHIKLYDSELKVVSDTLLDDSYSGFIYVGNSVVLMGYDKLNSMSL